MKRIEKERGKQSLYINQCYLNKVDFKKIDDSTVTELLMVADERVFLVKYGNYLVYT